MRPGHFTSFPFRFFLPGLKKRGAFFSAQRKHETELVSGCRGSFFSRGRDRSGPQRMLNQKTGGTRKSIFHFEKTESRSPGATSGIWLQNAPIFQTAEKWPWVFRTPCGKIRVCALGACRGNRDLPKEKALFFQYP